MRSASESRAKASLVGMKSVQLRSGSGFAQSWSAPLASTAAMKVEKRPSGTARSASMRLTGAASFMEMPIESSERVGFGSTTRSITWITPFVQRMSPSTTLASP